VVAAVAALNLAYFGVEFTVALLSDSMSLFADSVDFLEDASINLLILVALRWEARKRSLIGGFLALVILVPGVATLWTAWQKLAAPVAPEPLALTLTGLGAFGVNVLCALLLSRHRHSGGSLTGAAFLSARNDGIANVAIILCGAVTAWTLSVWPDLVVGLGIAAMNADAAREVFQKARGEWRGAVSDAEA
jgi:Co/Zn/Cd efflux system component